ncbi:MAG: yecC [Microbacteriaceae bacterium]|nr:yecC [Microbacteriaceae bacterium]
MAVSVLKPTSSRFRKVLTVSKSVDKMPAVQMRHVSKAFHGQTVLDDVSLAVNAGSVTALIGPSGAGKSTLLRCVNLLERPDSGEVEVEGHALDVSKPVPAKELAALRRSVGMVFQSFNLFPHLTVRRNITLPQERILGRPSKEAGVRTDALLTRVGLGGKADAYPGTLSGGQQQRIAIARALALDPKVMLFDEPTSALDPELGMEVLAVMRELAAEGMTMIVVTHEMHFAREVSDHLVVMADGRIIEQGNPVTLMADPQHERTRKFLAAVTDR